MTLDKHKMLGVSLPAGIKRDVQYAVRLSGAAKVDLTAAVSCRIKAPADRDDIAVTGPHRGQIRAPDEGRSSCRRLPAAVAACACVIAPMFGSAA